MRKALEMAYKMSLVSSDPAASVRAIVGSDSELAGLQLVKITDKLPFSHPPF